MRREKNREEEIRAGEREEEEMRRRRGGRGETEEDDGGLSSACHRSQPQTESGLYNYGLSPHQSSSGRDRGGGGAFVLRGQGREVIGVQSLAQIVFYRLSHLAFKVPAIGDPEGD